MLFRSVMISNNYFCNNSYNLQKFDSTNIVERNSFLCSGKEGTSGTGGIQDIEDPYNTEEASRQDRVLSTTFIVSMSIIAAGMLLGTFRFKRKSIHLAASD